MRQRVANITIRNAVLDDAETLARLIEELGYPTAGTQMRRRLDAILSDDDYDTLVACDDNVIVGLIGTRRGPLYEDDDQYGEIMALAVAPSHQRRGVGRMLMHAAESNLAARGARVLVVTSGIIAPMRMRSTRDAGMHSRAVATRNAIARRPNIRLQPPAAGVIMSRRG